MVPDHVPWHSYLSNLLHERCQCDLLDLDPRTQVMILLPDHSAAAVPANVAM